MIIPKVIHYVWVGGKDKPKDIKRCMKTWPKHLQGYEIIEWNESNFKMDSHPFLKQAYKAKKWAFVSDYIRAYVIYHYGGIYFDTDILLIDKPDTLLKNRAFVGFENLEYPFTAVFGAEKKHPFVKDMLDYYDDIKIKYNFEDNNTRSVSQLLINKYDCKPNNKEQLLKEGIRVYPDGVLCNPSHNSIAIHIFTGSWLENKTELKRNIVKFLKLRLTTKQRIIWFLKLGKVLK